MHLQSEHCAPIPHIRTCTEHRAMHLQPEHRAIHLHRAHRAIHLRRASRNAPSTSRISTADRTAIETCITICSPNIAQCSCTEHRAMLLHRASRNAPSASHPYRAIHLRRARKSRPRNAIGFRLLYNRGASRQTLRPRFTKRAPYAKPFFSSAKTSVIYLYDRFRRSAVFIFPRGLKPADDSVIEPLSPAPT